MRSPRNRGRRAALGLLVVLCALPTASGEDGREPGGRRPPARPAAGVPPAAAERLARTLRQQVRQETARTGQATQRRLQRVQRALAPYHEKAMEAARAAAGWDVFARRRRGGIQAARQRAQGTAQRRPPRGPRLDPAAELAQYAPVRDAALAVVDASALRRDVRRLFGEPARHVDPEDPTLFWRGERPRRRAMPPIGGGGVRDSDQPSLITLTLRPPFSGPTVNERIASAPHAFAQGYAWADEGRFYADSTILSPPGPAAGSVSVRTYVGEYFTVPPGYRRIRVVAHLQVRCENVDALLAALAPSCLFGGVQVVGGRREALRLYLTGPQVSESDEWVLNQVTVLLPGPPCLPLPHVLGLSQPQILWAEVDVPQSGGEYLVVAGAALDHWVAGIAASVWGNVEGTVESFEIELRP